MSSKINELESQLLKLKEKEVKLKEELANQRKAADIKERKRITAKKCELADIFVKQFGEKILENLEEIEFYVSAHFNDIKDICDNYALQE